MSRYSLMQLRTISTALQISEVMASHNEVTLFFLFLEMNSKKKEKERQREHGETYPV